MPFYPSTYDRSYKEIEDDNARHMRSYLAALLYRLRMLESAGLFHRMHCFQHVGIGQMKDLANDHLVPLGLTADGLRNMSVEEVNRYIETNKKRPVDRPDSGR